MKSLASSIVSLILGFAIGWYIGQNHAKRETTEAVQQMVRTMESSAAAEAARDLRSIYWIQSGEADKALRSLCIPIANYYYQYGSDNRNPQRSRLRAAIEELASTNKVVAAELTNNMPEHQTERK